MAVVRRASSVGVRMLPGSLISERAKFWLWPMMLPSLSPCCIWASELLVGLQMEDGGGVDAEVFAVGAIEVDVEVGDQGAFGDGASGEAAGQRVHVFVIEGLVFRKGDGHLLQAAGAGEADGDAGGLADLVDGERAGAAQADEQKALRLGAGGEWSRRVSPSEALNSPVASQGAAALASVSEVVSSAGEGLASSPVAMSTAKTARSGVAKAAES
jgi:hypothetical protein